MALTDQDEWFTIAGARGAGRVHGAQTWWNRHVTAGESLYVKTWCGKNVSATGIRGGADLLAITCSACRRASEMTPGLLHVARR